MCRSGSNCSIEHGNKHNEPRSGSRRNIDDNSSHDWRRLLASHAGNAITVVILAGLSIFFLSMSYWSQNPDIIYQKRIDQGDRGIRETVMAMRQQMNLAKHDVKIAQLVQNLTAGLQTDVDKSRALTAWFTESIRYTNDDAVSMTEKGPQFIDIHQCPQEFQHCEPMELLYRPEALLFHVRAGDCDDFTMALGVMHELAGIRVRIVTIAADPTAPREFTHVYFQALLDGQWVPIDPVNRAQPWGWQLEKPFRREVIV